ncbi:MAG: class I SAM-dependent methyltransferase [Bryobacteraceae bacterium]
MRSPAQTNENPATAPGWRQAYLDLPSPNFIPRLYVPINRRSWSGHLAFADDLISALRPRLIVELGTHYGESYFGFCQSIAENGLDCLSYAVDHWLGEQQAGFYGEEVFQEVEQYNDAHYRAFSYLLRTTFDEAVKQFADESIDMLHIDGLHTYEACKHDFETWLPKIKPGGIILLHDVAVRRTDFGVWKMWGELASQFTETFAFHHWWGLGVLRKPGDRLARPHLLDLLFDSPPVVQERIRRQYAMYALYLESALGRKEERPHSVGPVAQVQIYPFRGGAYSESATTKQTVEFGRWSTLVFDFPEGVGTGPLRIDPADRPCTIELGEISITDQRSGELLWKARHVPDLRGLTFQGTVVVLPDEHRCLLFSYGDDPQFLVPALQEDREAIRVEISLRLDRSLDAVSGALNTQAQKREEEVKHARAAAEAEKAVLRAELRNSQGERMSLSAQIAQIAAERNQIRAELKRAQELIVSSRSQQAELEHERAIRVSIQESRSWRLSAPFRAFMHAVRKKS